MPKLLSNRDNQSIQKLLPVPSVDNSVLLGNTDGNLTWTTQDKLNLNKPIANTVYVSKNGNDSNDGKSLLSTKLTISSALSVADAGATVIVCSGTYAERNPLICPPDVIITGQDSSVIVTPKTPTADVFYINSGTIIEDICVSNHAYPSFAFRLAGGVIIKDPPIIRHCTVTTGPFLNDGTLFVPYKTIQIQNVAPGKYPIINNPSVPVNKRVSSTGAGGGVFINGADISVNSMERLAIIEHSLIISQGGVGIVVADSATAQVTSVDVKFSNVSYKTESGGKLLLNSCSSTYGNVGLLSTGRNPVIYDDGVAITGVPGTITGAEITSSGDSYLTPPDVIVDPPFTSIDWAPSTAYTLNEILFYDNNFYNVVEAGISGNTPPTHTSDVDLNGTGTLWLEYIGSTAEFTAVIAEGQVTALEVLRTGYGYYQVPYISIEGGGINGDTPANAAIAAPVFAPISQLVVSELTKSPSASNTLIINGGIEYQIRSASALSGQTSVITMIAPVNYVTPNSIITLYENSKLTANSHLFNFVGNGTTYNATLVANSEANTSNHVVEENGGNIFYTSQTETGIFSVGKIFEINQLTSTFTPNWLYTDLRNIGPIGPLIRNGVMVGVQLREISSNSLLLASNGSHDANTVPTQSAIVEYLQNEYLPLSGGEVYGELYVQNIFISGNTIASTELNQNIVLDPTGTGVLQVSNSRITGVALPQELTDAANKQYVDDLVTGGVTIPSILPHIWGSNQLFGTLTLGSSTQVDPADNDTKPLAGILMDDNIPSTSITTGTLVVTGGVGISGDLHARTKSFNISHPLDPNKRLVYGSLESPYHGIRLTGESTIKNGVCIVNLPNYISNLVSESGAQVQLTNIKHGEVLWIDEIAVKKNAFTVKTNNTGEYKFYWSFTGIRIDVDPLAVEINNEY